MTREEHIAKAEELLAKAWLRPVVDYGWSKDLSRGEASIAEAQVHATLALTAQPDSEVTMDQVYATLANGVEQVPAEPPARRPWWRWSR